jgi:hypothetical protein
MEIAKGRPVLSRNCDAAAKHGFRGKCGFPMYERRCQSPPNRAISAIMIRTHLLVVLGTAIAFAGGCVRYEYDVTRPAELTAHVGTRDDVVLKRDPLEYRLITVENRLVMRVQNDTDDPIQLVGEKSSVVDPKGESHPLRGLTIAPHSNAKLIFPPLRPVVERRGGPSFGIGVGTRIGYNNPRPFRDPWYDDDYYDGPRYLAVIEGDAYYWEFDGPGEIRVSLTYQRGEQTFNHEFVIRRVKV